MTIIPSFSINWVHQQWTTVITFWNKFRCNGPPTISVTWYERIKQTLGQTPKRIHDTDTILLKKILLSFTVNNYQTTYGCRNGHRKLRWEQPYRIPLSTFFSLHDCIGRVRSHKNSRKTSRTSEMRESKSWVVGSIDLYRLVEWPVFWRPFNLLVSGQTLLTLKTTELWGK